MDQEKIGKTLRETRKKNHLTQQEFAEKFGVTYQAVSKWENNKSIPDISILKRICDIYNLDLNELLSVEKSEEKKAKKPKWVYKIGVGLLVILVMLLLLITLNQESDFELKELTANCENFTITGSIAYNKNKTSIHISNINYCGKKDTNIYKKMECTLYEKNKERKTKIDDYTYKKIGGSTIEELLRNIKFNIHDYVKTCKSYTENSLELEINATNQKNQIITYKIPLKLEENCKDK